MVDNVTLNSGSGGASLATDDIGGVHHQRVKVQFGADGTATDVSSAAPLPVDLGANNDVTITSGSITANAGTNLNTSALALESGGNLATLAGAVAGAEMQVDVVAPLPAGTNNIGDVDVLSLPSTVHSADFDTGAGTDTTLAFGIAVPASGGAAVVPGDATAGLKVDLGADNDVTVTGTVTVNAGTNLNTSALALETGGNLATIAGAVSGTEMQVDVVAPLPAGGNAIGKLAANTGVDIGDVTINNGSGAGAVNIQDGGNSITVDGTITANLAAGSNLIGDVGISGTRTSGGTTLYKNIDVDQTEDQVKGTAGQVYWIHAVNLAAAPRFLKFYNATAASVTVGTTVPDLTFPIPSQGDTNGAGFVLAIPNGIAFSTAITIAATTGVGDTDAGAPGVNEVIVNLGYA